jgi:hypothetical protein
VGEGGGAEIERRRRNESDTKRDRLKK